MVANFASKTKKTKTHPKTKFLHIFEIVGTIKVYKNKEKSNRICLEIYHSAKFKQYHKNNVLTHLVNLDNINKKNDSQID